MKKISSIKVDSNSINVFFSNFFDEFRALNINKTVVIYAVCISVLFSLPLILNDLSFMDDYGRNINAYDWEHDGRYFASILMKILSMGDKITGISPYSVILSCLLLFFSAYIIISKQAQFSLKTNLLIASTIFASPFIFQNLSYRYDSLTMSLAVLFCVIPFVFIENIKKFSATSFVCLLLTCLTYQPAIVVYPLCVFITCTSIAQNNLRLAIKISIISFICFLMPIIIYVFIMNNIGTKPYYYEESQIIYSINPMQEIKSRFYEISYIFSSFNYIQKMLFFAIAVFSLIFIVYSAKFKYSFKERLYVVLMFLLAFPVSISMMLLLPLPISPRFFLGFPFVVILFLFIIKIQYEKIAITLSCILTLTGFSMISAYSFAYKEQYNFEKNQILMAFSGVNMQNKVLAVKGGLPYKDSAVQRMRNFPIIPQHNFLHMHSMHGDMTMYFIQDLGIIKPYQYATSFPDNIKCSMNLTKQSIYFNLYETDKLVFLDFEKELCKTANKIDLKEMKINIEKNDNWHLSK